MRPSLYLPQFLLDLMARLDTQGDLLRLDYTASLKAYKLAINLVSAALPFLQE